ncbi:MAG: hypothetical protein R3D63_10820 [Paracoccaceae bacterium]
MFDKLLQASLRRHDFLGLLGQSDLLPLQLFDARFIGPDHRRARRINDTVQQRFDLLLGIPKLNLDGLLRTFGLTQPRFPHIDEHGSGNRIELLRRLQRAKDEPRRVCRRLQLLSKVEHHEQDNEQVFSGSA